MSVISESDSNDSDAELQKAFEEGRLKPGLNRPDVQPKQKKKINNTEGLRQKFQEFHQNLPWIERLDVGVEPTRRLTTEEEVNDDFKREIIFYRQAQAAVLIALPRLQKLGVTTKRPDDYYAEMAKPDSHMMKIREKLFDKKKGMERSDAAKKLRAAKKLGKKIQTEVTQQRHKEKRDLQNAVKQHKKGKPNNLGEILKNSGPMQPNKKRQMKNKKFGFGGQKKRSKRNDKTSFVEAISGQRMPKKRSSNKQLRPGKSRRRNMKSRK